MHVIVELGRDDIPRHSRGDDEREKAYLESFRFFVVRRMEMKKTDTIDVTFEGRVISSSMTE